MMQGSWRDSAESGSRVQGVGGWVQEAEPTTPIPHTHCQCSFSLLAAGPHRSWLPLCAMDRTRL